MRWWTSAAVRPPGRPGPPSGAPEHTNCPSFWRTFGHRQCIGELGSYFPRKVTYHPSCRGMWLPRLEDKQLNLLNSVDAIEPVELPGVDRCCRSGGAFSE